MEQVQLNGSRYFFQPQPLRTLGEIRVDILALEKKTQELLDEMLGGGTA